MATFAIPTTDNAELAGPLTEFKDKLVALQVLGKLINVGTKFGPAAALRVQVVDPMTGADEGIRLLFWGTMQAQLTAVHAKGDDWAVGVISEQAQKEDPDKSFYTLVPPASDVDYAVVGRSLDAFESRSRSESHPNSITPVVGREDAPF